MNPSFSPEETISETVTASQDYSFSPEERAPDPTTLQFYQGGLTISLKLDEARSSQTAWLSGVYLDDEGTLIQRPLRVFICEDEAGFHAENEELSIFACGPSIIEAIDDFKSALLATWQGLKNVPESELTADAVDLRRHLMTYIKVA